LIAGKAHQSDACSYYLHSQPGKKLLEHKQTQMDAIGFIDLISSVALMFLSAILLNGEYPFHRLAIG